jgi:hypothetical protein
MRLTGVTAAALSSRRQRHTTMFADETKNSKLRGILNGQQ